MALKLVAIAFGALGAQVMAPVVVKPLEPILRPMVVEIERDPITDTVSAFAVARSSDGRLGIGCDPDRYPGVRVSLRSQAWFHGRPRLTWRHATMTYRFDRAPAEHGRWEVKEDAAILRPPAQIFHFVNSAAAANRLTIRTRDIENREKDLTFSMQGGASAIKQMLQVCAPRR